MKSSDLVAEIEALLPCYDGFQCAHAQTGDEYVHFSVRGDTEAALCLQLREMILLYVEPRMGSGVRLFWRYISPRIFWYPKDREEYPCGRLQTRLVVTGRDIRWFSEAEYDAARRAQLEREILGIPQAS